MLYRSLPSGRTTALDLFRFAFADRWRDLRRVFFLGVLIALVGMASIQAIGLIVDRAIPRGDRGLLAQIGFGLVAMAVGSAGCAPRVPPALQWIDAAKFVL